VFSRLGVAKICEADMKDTGGIIGAFAVWAFIFWGVNHVWVHWGIKDWIEVNVTCTHKNFIGHCLTDDEYLRQVARDAANDALFELTTYCGWSFHRGESRCLAFHPTN